MKESGENTRPLGYDLNKIPYDYTVEAKNRFKGWTEVHNIVYKKGNKTIEKKKKCNKAKWLSEEALQIADQVVLVVKNLPANVD